MTIGSRHGCFSSIAKAALSLCLIFSSGCSLINPHVIWDRTEATEPTLKDGIDYANRAKDEYKRAIGDQAVLTSSLGIVLIPLGAAALGMGIAGSHGTSIAALGLSGAAGLGVGSWLSSKPRQLAYAAGIKAMGCAVDAMLPLNFTKEERDKFKKDLSELNTAIGNLESMVGSTKMLVEQVKKEAPEQKDLIEKANKNVEIAESLLDTAKTTWSTGTRLDQELSRAGQVLISAVDRIGAEVDIWIVKTESDVSALQGVINGLAKTSSQFTKTPESKESPGGMSGKDTKAEKHANRLKADAKDLKADAEEKRRDHGNLRLRSEADKLEAEAKVIDELNNELARMKKSAETLSDARRKVAAVVDRVSEAKSVAALKQCGVEEVPTGITVQPEGLVKFEKGKPGTRQLVISGGKPPYAARLLEHPVDGLTVDQPAPFGPMVTVQATDKAPVGEYNVYIADTASNSKTVRVVVKAPDDAEQTLTEEQIKEFQQALCMKKLSGKIDDETRMAIKGFQKARGLSETGKLTQDQIAFLSDPINKTPCKSDRLNYYEKSLAPNAINDIQKKLGMKQPNQTSELDAMTREAIKKFKTEHGIQPVDDQLWEEVVKAIMNSTKTKQHKNERGQ